MQDQNMESLILVSPCLSYKASIVVYVEMQIQLFDAFHTTQIEITSVYL